MYLAMMHFSRCRLGLCVAISSSTSPGTLLDKPSALVSLLLPENIKYILFSRTRNSWCRCRSSKLVSLAVEDLMQSFLSAVGIVKWDQAPILVCGRGTTTTAYAFSYLVHLFALLAA